jgi:hypothetical protein
MVLPGTALSQHKDGLIEHCRCHRATVSLVRRWWLVLASLGFTAGICLGLAAPGSALTRDQLHSKLLSLSNLPTGWAVDTTSSSGGSVTAGCLAGLKRPPAQKGEFEVTVKYENGQIPLLNELLVAGPGSVASYNRVNHILAGCKRLSGTSGGQTITATVGAMSFPKVGTASAAYAVTASSEGISVGADFVVFRVGSIAGMIEYADLGQPDASQLRGFVTEAVNKVEGKPAGPSIAT